MVCLPLCFLFPLPPKDMCDFEEMASFPSSACEGVRDGCRHITSVFLEPFPSLPVLAPFHMILFCHSPQLHQLARLMETVNSACFSVHLRHGKSFPTLLTLHSGKAGKNLVSWSQAHSGRLTYCKISSFRHRGERVQGTCK